MVDSKTSSVTIVMLNWNTSDDTRECLDSLLKLDYPKFDLILLDNASKPADVAKMVEHWRVFDEGVSKDKIMKMDPVLNRRDSSIDFIKSSESCDGRKWWLLLNDMNYGFAEGNNMGIRFQMERCRSDFYLLLNNDTVVDPEFLRKMIEHAELRKDIGILGPMVYYYDFHGRKDTINMLGGIVDVSKGIAKHLAQTEVDKGQYQEPRKVDWVEGSCMLIRTSAMDQIGMLNANYFAYWEELDLCMRAAENGIGVAAVPSAKIWHKVSASTKGTAKNYYFYRNRFWFVKDHGNYATRMKFSSQYFIKVFPKELLSVLNSGKKWAYYTAFARGIFDGLIKSSQTPVNWNAKVKK